jgi:energy-coupling factor transporter ATP-binding protein EcfA2
MRRTIIPQDSILHHWVSYLSITELPLSYQILCGLSGIGCLLKRNLYLDDLEFRVYPNLSVMLVGPSGIGKDVIINATAKVIREVGGVEAISGRTMEYVKQRLVEIGDPAVAYLTASELTAFLGGKDYQKSMVQELTDLLSTNDYMDVSTKGDGTRYILRPTVTMHAGTTDSWLLKAMPDGALDGGFLPRFVVICEEYGNRYVPWVKFSLTAAERVEAKAHRETFVNEVKEIAASFAGRPREIIPNLDAQDYYTNWYCNRFKYFSEVVRPYANRSRSHMHRLAMLMAVSRHHNYMEEVDYVFAKAVMEYIAASIDRVARAAAAVAAAKGVRR